jgi:hypothetical protein
MDRHNSRRARRLYLRTLGWFITLSAMSLYGGSSRADEAALPAAPESAAPPSLRSGGLFEGSFNYHRQSPPQPAAAAASYRPANGWYGYGFPVQSYRWGWFGADRDYPRVMWHTGYYGDCVRTAYRYGY